MRSQNMWIVIIFILSPALFFSGCQKKTEQLPQANIIKLFNAGVS